MGRKRSNGRNNNNPQKVSKTQSPTEDQTIVDNINVEQIPKASETLDQPKLVEQELAAATATPLIIKPTTTTRIDEVIENVPKANGFPKSVLFIVGNEFCERFSFYGMKAILPIYLTSWLGFQENKATTIIHAFNFSAYFFALFGGILSDNFLGKFRTILYLSIVYCIGNIIMSLTALPGITTGGAGTPTNWWGVALGLSLIGIGTGGIKPCVASFGGDQFEASQTHELSMFFSIFYFAINAGSVLSMFFTPILRKNVHCFGQESCYPLAFGVPAVLMFVALIVFIAGSRSYKKEPVLNNAVVKFFSLIGTAAWRKLETLSSRNKDDQRQDHLLTSHNHPPPPPCHHHWLYLAGDKYETTFIEDTRRVLAVFLVFSPVCIFWALYDQQGSWWVYQAVMMKNHINFLGWSITILPEQMGLANAVLILILVPLFSHILYPSFEKAGTPLRALVRIFFGMILGMSSFVIAAFLQFIIGANGTFTSSPNDPSLQVCIDGCVNILWQLPQYLILTCAEVFLSVTGLEFAYSQAPTSMKSVCQAGWLLTVAGGNFIVIILTLIDPVSWFKPTNPMAWNFCIWTVIMGIGSVLFAFLAWEYQYREDGPIEGVSTESNPTSPLYRTDSQLSFESDTPLLSNRV